MINFQNSTFKAYFLRDTFSRSSVHQSHRDSLYGCCKTGLEKHRCEQKNGDTGQRGCCRPAQSEQGGFRLMDQCLVLLESWSVLRHLDNTVIIT